MVVHSSQIQIANHKMAQWCMQQSMTIHDEKLMNGKLQKEFICVFDLNH